MTPPGIHPTNRKQGRERDQQEWEATNGEQLQCQQEQVRVMVQTPHFMRGEHGVGIEGQAGQRQWGASHDEMVAHSTGHSG
jgi:hypothetical protein